MPTSSKGDISIHYIVARDEEDPLRDNTLLDPTDINQKEAAATGIIKMLSDTENSKLPQEPRDKLYAPVV